MGYKVITLRHYKFILDMWTGINLYYYNKFYKKYKFIVACGKGLDTYFYNWYSDISYPKYFLQFLANLIYCISCFCTSLNT